MAGNLETLFLEAGVEVILNEESGRCNQKRATFIQRKLIELYESEIIKRFGQEFYDKLHAKYLLDVVTQKRLKEDREEAKLKKQEDRINLKRESIKLRKKELAIREENKALRDEKYDVVRDEKLDVEAGIKNQELNQEKQRLDDTAYKIKQKLSTIQCAKSDILNRLEGENNPARMADYKKRLVELDAPEAITKRNEDILKLNAELAEINAKIAEINAKLQVS